MVQRLKTSAPVWSMIPVAGFLLFLLQQQLSQASMQSMLQERTETSLISQAHLATRLTIMFDRIHEIELTLAQMNTMLTVLAELPMPPPEQVQFNEMILQRLEKIEAFFLPQPRELYP